MPTRVVNAEILEGLCQEGERLTKQRPRCHYTSGDLQCILLIRKLHAAGFEVSVADAQRCLERIRIAAETGTYPQALLNEEEGVQQTKARRSAGKSKPALPLAPAAGKPGLNGRRRRGRSGASAASDPQTAASADCTAGHPENAK